MEKPLSVGLAGAGAMGGALFKGWLKAGMIDAASSAIFDPQADEDMRRLVFESGARLNPPVQDLSVDALVLALKPQAAAAALPAYARLADGAVVVSVMAGTSLARLSEHLGSPPRVVRAMPNLPAGIGAGISGLYAPSSLDAASRRIAERLLSAAGDVVWVDSEQAVDVVTAISGSGPAYFFLLTEALAEAGEGLGLPRETALRLARATAAGAGALLAADPREPGAMRAAVTSPGGTTAAALSVLDGETQMIRILMKDAAAAAARRAAELTQ